MSDTSVRKNRVSFLLICIVVVLFVICRNCWTITEFIQDADITKEISDKKLIPRRITLISTNNSDTNGEISDDSLMLVPLMRNNTDSIIFLKTHKTASSSITNLLHTLVVRHNKSCPIFDDKIVGKQFNFSDKKDRKIVLNSNTWNGDKQLDVWLNHAIFNEYLYELIPSSKNQIMTIIRNPNDRFLSAWSYYNAQSRYKMNISQFIDQYFDKFDLIDVDQLHFKTDIPTEIQLNCLCKEIIPNNKWNQIQSGNFLVLIADRFDESLLLLKEAYNLKWEDLFYKKMTKKPERISKRILIKNKIKLTKEQDIKLKRLQDCDWKLYEIATKIFDQRLYEIYGDNKSILQQDIDIMSQIQFKQRDKCLLHSVKLTLNEQRICKSRWLDNQDWNKWAKEVKSNKR